MQPTPRPFTAPFTQKRILLWFAAGLVASALAFILINRWIEADAELTREVSFGKRQQAYAGLVGRTLGDTLHLPLAVADGLAATSGADILTGRMDQADVEARFRVVCRQFPTITSVAVLDAPSSFAARVDISEDGTKELVRSWSRMHWKPLTQSSRSSYVPGMRLASGGAVMGVLRPIVEKGRFLGLLALTVDLGAVLDAHLPKPEDRQLDRFLVLDDAGAVIVSPWGIAPGRGFIGNTIDGKPLDPTTHRRLISEPRGRETITGVMSPGNSPQRILLAWDAFHVANRRLTLVVATPEDAGGYAIRSLLRRHMVLSGALFMLLAAFVAYVYRRTAHADLLAGHRKLLDVIEFLPDPTFVVDRDGTVIAWNKAIAEVTGTKAEDILGKGGHAYSAALYGDHRPGLIDLLNTTEHVKADHLQNVRRDGRAMYAEAFMPALNGGAGAHVWATASQLLNRSGEPAGAIESFRDISDRLRVERKLRESEERYALALRGANDGIWDWDIRDDTVYYSPRWKAIIGYEDHEVRNMADEWSSRIHPQDRERVIAANMTVLNGVAENFEVEYRLRHKDGAYRWVLGRGAGLRDRHGKVQRMVGSHTDITGRKEGEIASRTMLGVSRAVSSAHGLPALYAEVHRLLFENIGADTFYIALVHPERDLLEFVYARDPHHGQDWDPVPISSLGDTSLTMAVYRENEPMLLDKERQIAMKAIGRPAEQWLGAPIRIRGCAVGVMAINDYFDPSRYTRSDLDLLCGVADQVGLALERRRGEEERTRQALYDPLTGQPNRTLFLDRLTRALSRRSRRGDFNFAVAILDLDRFKLINDSHGHPAGDKVLREAARRIAPMLRSPDTLARLGGDEFGVLIEDYDKPQEVIHTIRAILEAVAAPMSLGGGPACTTASTTASAGVVMRTSDYESAEDLLRDADIAMYQAKDQGKGLFRVFNPGMHQAAMSAMALEADLSTALENDEFLLHYQPMFHAVDGALAGFEALVRWRRGGGPLSPPDEFIPCAEETGLILPLGEWVTGKACATMAGWIKAVPRAAGLTLSVNISARQAAHNNLVAMVRKALERAGLPATNLELELTETAAMRDPAQTRATLKRLKNLGVGLSIDDFGTGYSSLSHLSRFPMDALKVDRSFVAGLDRQDGNPEIVRAIVGLARVLELRVVAEGVETEDQLQRLRDLGCTLVQGYHLGRPMDADTALALIAAEVAEGRL